MDVEQIKEKYELRFIAVLNKFRSTLDNTEEIMDWCDDEYAWSFRAKDEKYFISLELLEEAIREGDGNGLALSLTILGKEGIVLSVWSPYNYTNKLWCHKERQFEQRVQLLESLPKNWVKETINERDLKEDVT